MIEFEGRRKRKGVCQEHGGCWTLGGGGGGGDRRVNTRIIVSHYFVSIVTKYMIKYFSPTPLSVNLPKSAASSKAFILYQCVGTVDPSAVENIYR